MATTFVKQTNGNVWITEGSNDPISAPGGAFISPHPDEENVIMISEKFNPQNRDEALKIYVPDVTVPEATDRKDLIEKLSTDFFFRVTTFDPETVLAYSKVEVDGLIPKFPVIHTTSVSHTGTVTPTVILTKTITIGNVTLDGFVKIEMIVQANNTPNIKAFDVKLNGTSVLVQQIDASKRSNRMSCLIISENSLSNQVVGGYGLSWGSSSNDLVETTIDFSAEVTLTVTCTLAVVTDTAYIRGLIIETK